MPVQDDFGRPDANALGTATSGQPWTEHAGGFAVDGGTAVGKGGFGLASVDGARTDAAVNVTVVVPDAEFWLVVRLQDDDDYWRFGRAGGGAYQLQLVRSGAVSTPGVQVLASLAAAAGDRLECRTGGVVACSVNGRLTARTTDASLSTATRHGLSTWQSGSARFDDFRAAPVPLAPDLSVTLDAPAAVPAGGSLRATAFVTNNGVGPAVAAALVWTVPTDVTTLSGSTSAGPCTVHPGQLSCPVGDLLPGAGVTATFAATAPLREGTVSLGLAATQSGADGAPVDDAATASVLLRTDLDPGTVVADGFSRPDTASGWGSGDTGHAWTTVHGAPAVLESAASPGQGYGLATVESGLRSGTVSVTVPALGTEFWLITRLSSDGDYWRFGRSNSGPYQLQLIRGNGLASPALDVRATVTPKPGDRLSCRATDVALTCSVGAVVVVRTTDSTGRTATRHGLAGYASPETRLDDFAVVAPVPRPDLQATLAVPRLLPSSGGSTAVTTILNTGTASAPATTVLVGLPAGGSFPGGQPSSCAVTGREALCRLGDLAPGASASVTVEVTAPAAPGPVTTTARAASATTDDDAANDASSAGSLVYDASLPPPLVYDSFSRADAGAPDLTETGQPWRVHAGALAVAGGAAAPGGGYVLATVDVGVDDGIVTTKVLQPGTEFWSVVRFQDGANFWRFGRSAGGPYQLQLVRANGLASPVVETLATVVAAAGDRLECRAGSGLSCSVNGVPVARTVDASLGAATAHGVATWNSPETRLDEVTVAELPRVADIAVGLSGTRSVLVSGALSYTATVANVGTANADSSVLSGSLPAGTSGITLTPSAGSCTSSETTFSCSFGQLAPGGSRTLQVRATAPPAAGATTASVWGQTSSTDGEPTNDRASLSTTVRPPTPPGAAVRDDFDRANGPLGTTTSGQPWTVHTGDLAVVGGRAGAPTAATSSASVETGFAGATYDVTVAAGATERWWLAVHVQDAANQYRIGPDPGTGEYRLVKILNGVERPLYASMLRSHVRAADGDVLRVVVRPDDGIYLWVNGQHVLDAGDPDLLDATGFGFGTASAVTRFDDLVVSSALEAYPVSDTFSRADSTDTLGTPESGSLQPWRVWLGSPWAVRSGHAAPLSTGGLIALDASTEAATLRARFSAVGAEQWLVFRYAEDGSYYRFGAGVGGQYQVQFVRGYSVQPPPVPVQTLNPPVVAAGDEVAVVQRFDGSVQLTVGGTVTHLFTDTVTNRRATIYGLAAEGGLPRFDDVSIVPAPRT